MKRLFVQAAPACLCLCLGWSALAAPAAPPAAAAGEDRTFAPAFTADMVALAQCRQYVNGKEAPAAPERVQRALGFFPAEGDYNHNVWEVGGDNGLEAAYEFLVVFKQPIRVGTIALSPAEGLRPPGGSINGGELFLLKAGAQPDPTRKSAWAKVAFASPPQHLRFATLPPGTSTRAFLYKDVRTQEPAQLFFLNAWQNRLQDLTIAAAGACSPSETATDAGALPLGRNWKVTIKDGIADKTPASYSLLWDRKRRLNGLFLFTNADKFRILAFDGEGDPGVAPAEAWKPVAFADAWSGKQALPSWKWLSFPALDTAALRIEATGTLWSPDVFWIHGFAAFTALGDREPLALKPQEANAPFLVRARIPMTGDAALVIEDAKGRRVRNLFAQTPQQEGPIQEPWDLKDETGAYVTPGRYTWKTIAGPQLALTYGVTPYPNLQNFFPERMPWLIGHEGVHGWLSDHNVNWACATSGDHVYFASTMAEAGSTLIDCDLEGRRLWGRHDFGPWTGVYRLAADARSLYVLDANMVVRRIDIATRKELSSFRPNQGPHRRAIMASSIAAHDGKLYIAHDIEPVFDNAGTPDLLDLQQCLPTPPDRSLLQLLRMEGDPPGGEVNPASDQPQGNGRLYLESQPPVKDAPDGRKVSVIAFKQPVPVGSLVFPWPAGEGKLQFAALKPNAPWPPQPERDADWSPFEASGGPGWNCVAAPPGLVTKAVRVLFEPKDKDGKFWRLDGLRLLNRRFANVFPAARVRVNSGKVSPEGEWDAERTAPVAPDKPGIYVMDWKAARKLSGLAFKEIDGAIAEIDVWQGPPPADVPLDGPALDRKSKATGWRNVATHKQKRRISDYVANMNRCANYMDGYVEFPETIETVAVRIRITAQWLDNSGSTDASITPGGSFCRRHDGRGEHGVHMRNSYCTWLDPRVCKVLGVAALSPLGDDPPRDPLTYVRLEVWDATTGTFIKELPSRIGWDGLSFDADGTLYAIEMGHKDICRVDLDRGKLTPVIHEPDGIRTFAIGPDKSFYVYGGGNPIHVYDAQGRKIRDIGKAGVVKPGLWDPQMFLNLRAICVDRAGSLWALEEQNAPRRIVQYKTDGTFVKELLGNTQYGGGGTLDRTDPSRAFYNGMEFAIDGKTHSSRLRSWFGSDFLGGEVVAQRRADRVYLLTQPLVVSERQQVGVVYLFDEKAGAVRPAAAMGDAGSFPPLRSSDVLAALPPGSVPGGFEFLWFDRNGNGKADAAEVDFRKKDWTAAVGNFDDGMGCPGYGVYYAMTGILPNGVPAYKRVTVPGWPNLRLNDGSMLTLHGAQGPGLPTENSVVAPNGEKRWGYPAQGGVSGLSIPGWEPGLVRNQLCLIGHETAAGGDLGEFFVVSDNTGQWRIWTADGLLAGNVLYHQADARARLLGPPDAKFGTRLDPLCGKQELFHGFFTRTDDNRYFIIVGFVHMSIIEVKGIEKFRRASGVFDLTAADIERVRFRGSKPPSGTGKARALAAQNVTGKPPAIDGKLAPGEWPEGTLLPGIPDVSFRLAYDADRLYLCWTGKGVGPIANDGQDFRRVFKTGACLDFQIAADDKADPGRAAPAKGDQRLLVTFIEKQPCVVLYQPVAPGAAPGEAWSANSQAGGLTKIDRIVQLRDGVAVAASNAQDFAVEVAVPLKAPGLRPTAGLRLRGDWGILTSADGHQVKARAYWSNAGATGTADEAVEARLEPQFWGVVEFR